MSFFENTRKPAGFGGRLMVWAMNLGHRKLAGWGFQFLGKSERADILDCGCGGGANIRKLLRKYPDSRVRGIDVSEISVEKSRKVNRREIHAGRCEILKASAEELPFADGTFNLVTAFETVYFWPGLTESFREIRRVLAPGGMFLICNECSGDTAKDDRWTEVIFGMRIYRDTQLKAALEQAGFHGVQIQKNRKGWLCVTAQK